VRFPIGSLPNGGLVDFELPGTPAIKMSMARLPTQATSYEFASLQTVAGDWLAYRAMSLWLFHTPPGALPNLPPGIPAIASTCSV
jgi:cellulose synthase (UDP-forming)